MRRQHQRMDRPGVCQVPESSGDQGKMEEIGYEVICGAPMTPTVKGEVKEVGFPLSCKPHLPQLLSHKLLLRPTCCIVLIGECSSSINNNCYKALTSVKLFHYTNNSSQWRTWFSNECICLYRIAADISHYQWTYTVACFENFAQNPPVLFSVAVSLWTKHGGHSSSFFYAEFWLWHFNLLKQLGWLTTQKPLQTCLKMFTPVSEWRNFIVKWETNASESLKTCEGLSL